jgi:hypothetical protein
MSIATAVQIANAFYLAGSVCFFVGTIINMVRP